MKNTSRILLLVVLALASCSRPVAYVQRTPLTLYPVLSTQPIAKSSLNHGIALATGPITTTDSATTPPELVAHNSNRLVLANTLSKHTERVKIWLSLTHEATKHSGTNTTAPSKPMHRGIVQKIDQKKTGQFVPSTIKKARANWIKLIGGVILLVVGAVIMVSGPGSIYFLGLVIALFGFVGIILGLFAE
ncbi:hypothetical protein GGR92_004949 [Spirosoma lacussanchae]|uniref:hypothetical protein n=1 Tax=Spirosoma lacussanchae TaxID=1884249 RepID=UPI00110880BA|nr:hypothetical protein [Spirosoma lacussanchae]